MKASVSNKSDLRLVALAILLICIQSGAFLAWVFWVEPFPDVDAGHFFIQFQNLLKESLYYQTAFYFDSVSDWANQNGNIPPTMNLIPFILSVLGLQSTFLAEPYLRELLLVLPMALCPFFLFPSRSKLSIALASFVVFFLPFHQILLKSFEHHSYNVIYSILGLLFLCLFLIKKNRKYLIGFVVFAGLSASVKHLGMIHLLNILMVLTLSFLLRRSWSPALVAAMTLSLLISLPLYNPGNTMELFRYTLEHTEGIGLIEFLILLGVFFGGAAFLLYWVGRNKENRPIPRFSRNLLLPNLIFLVMALLSYSGGKEQFVLPILLVGYGAAFFFVSRFQVNLRFILYLLLIISLIHSSLLFTVRIANTIFVLMFPVYLAFLIAFLEQPKVRLLALNLLVFLAVSNFFPSLQTLERHYPEQVHIYSSCFLMLHQNPLGWQKSDFRRNWQDLWKRVSEVDLEQGRTAYFEILGFHFNTRQQLQISFPRYFDKGRIEQMDKLEPEEGERVRKQYFHLGQEKLFEKWSEEGKFLFFVEALRPYLKIQDLDMWDYEIENPRLMLNHFTINLPLRYYQYLREKELLETDYLAIPVPARNPRFVYRVHKSYALARDLADSEDLEPYHAPVQIEVGELQEYPLELIELDKPAKNPDVEESARLFTEATNYYSSDPKRAIEMLQKAHSLDPDNLSLKEDLEMLLEANNSN